MISTWLLFLIFLKVRLFAYGGGGVLYPLLQDELVSGRGLLSINQFLDATLIGRLVPGPNNVMAMFMGYQIKSYAGFAAATLAMVLPSYSVLPLDHYYKKIKDNRYVQGATKGMLYVIGGLILGTAFSLGSSVIVNLSGAIIALISFIVIFFFKKDPVWVIFGSLLAGIVLYY